MGIIKTVRSFAGAMRASSALSRAYRQQEQGHLTEALVQAERGLAILQQPHVLRGHPAEAAALASLTVLAEQLACRLHVPGACPKDVGESLAYLKAASRVDPRPELCAYIPFLEARLEAIQGPPA
jgi:hypothetical protein